MKKKTNTRLLLGILALLIAGAIPLCAQDAPPPGDAPPENVEGADSSDGNGGEALARFLMGRLGEYLKSGKVFFPESTGEGEDAEEDDGKVTLNFNGAEINQVLKFVSDLLGKPLIKSDEVNGNINLMMPDPVTKEEALRKVETILALKNFTLVETDGMLLALTVEQAMKAGVHFQEGDPEQPTARLQTQTIELKFADAVRMKETLTPLFTDPTRVIADPRTNQLIVTDTGVNIARIAEIVKRLDREDEGTRIVTEFVKLEYANARQLSQALEGLLNHLNSGGIGGRAQQRGKPGQSGASGLTTQIFADSTTNTLIVSGTAPEVEMILQFISELDTSTSEGMVTQTFKLKFADAEALTAELNELMQVKRSGFRQPAIVADSWTNSILVTGFPDDISFVDELVGDLDRVKTTERDTRVFTLKHADAAVLSTAIAEVVGEGGQQDYWSRYSRRYGGGDDDEVKIYEDLRLNALIISAKVEDFAMIEELIDSLDRELDKGNEEPRVFPVKYADATALAQIIEDLFEDDTNSYYYFYGGNQQSPVSALAGKVRVIAEPTTNNLIVIASTPRAFDVVEGLLKEVDTVAEFGSTFVVPLKDANADDLAGYLNELFEDDNQSGGGNRGFFWFLSNSMGGEREISNLIGNVRIVAEPRTNSLIITTQQQNFTSIQDLIERLDQATAQVLVEILIVEMTTTDARELGIQWGVANGTVGRTEILSDGSGNYQNFGSIAAAPLNSFNYSMLTQSQFGVVLNYLAADSKTNVVARPNIMTSNNEPAVVRLIQRVPFVEDVTFQNNNVNFSIDYEDVGLVLSVTPQINIAQVEEDKRVTLQVTLENGEVLENISTVSVDDVELSAFSKRQVNTHVTVSNKMTVVLSGVLSESESDFEDGIPGLRRIPILGRLFRSDAKRKTKTELLTFITPYILSNAEGLDEVTRKQMESDAYRFYLEEHQNDPALLKPATGTVDVFLDSPEDTVEAPKPKASRRTKRSSVGRR